MAFSLKYHDSEELNVFLNNIESQSRQVEEEYLNIAGNTMKEQLAHNLKLIKTQNNDIDYKHMADDVTKRTVLDKNSNSKVVRIRGGKKTGTLWHIVNDGTYRTQATHFIDTSLSQVDDLLDAIVDREMEKAGF